jgi:hypothetical protein
MGDLYGKIVAFGTGVATDVAALVDTGMTIPVVAFVVVWAMVVVGTTLTTVPEPLPALVPVVMVK